MTSTCFPHGITDRQRATTLNAVAEAFDTIADNILILLYPVSALTATTVLMPGSVNNW